MLQRSVCQNMKKGFSIAVLAKSLWLQEMLAEESQQLSTSLVTAAIRVGQAEDALSVMKDGSGLAKNLGSLLRFGHPFCRCHHCSATCGGSGDFIVGANSNITMIAGSNESSAAVTTAISSLFNPTACHGLHSCG